MKQEKKTYELLAKIHIDNVPKNNISQKLGIKATEIFYKTVLSSKYSKAFFLIENNKVVFSSLVFLDYEKFNKELNSKLILTLIIGLISFRIPAKCVIDIFKKKQSEMSAFRNVSKKCHLGLFFSNKDFRPESTIKLIANFEKLHNYAKDNFCKNIWGVVNKENINANKFLQKLGYKIFYESKDEIYLNKTL